MTKVVSRLCTNKPLFHDENHLGHIVNNDHIVGGSSVKCVVSPTIRFLIQDSGAEYIMHVHVDGKEVFPDKEKLDFQEETIRMIFVLPPEIWRLSDFRVDVRFQHGSHEDGTDTFMSFLLPAPAKILRSVLYLAGFGFSPLFRKIGICDDREECSLGLVITPKLNDENRLMVRGVADCSCVESHSDQVSFMLTI